VVKVATKNNLFLDAVHSYDYITVNGLDFEGSISDAIYQPDWNTQYNTINNCRIAFAGGQAISSTSPEITISNNVITDCAVGIWTGNTGVIIGAHIISNTISNIGLIEGQYFSTSRGINTNSDNGIIQYNTLNNIDYHGIAFWGNSAAVKNNIISNFCVNMDDGGGIYTDGSYSSTGEVIDSNIIYNGIGKGGGPSIYYGVHGIYMDYLSSYITVTNNSMYNNNGWGIMLSNINNCTLQYNTCYDNLDGALYILEYDAGSIHNNTFTDNIFFAKAISQLPLQIQVNVGTLGNFGTADRNYYARPIDDNITIWTYEEAVDNNRWQARTLANWQSYSGQDVHSHKSPKSVTSVNDILFEYNPTAANKVVALSGSYVDVKNVSYSGSVTLKPFTSIVLIKN
jgi:parallel beta-helix repeat protein